MKSVISVSVDLVEKTEFTGCFYPENEEINLHCFLTETQEIHRWATEDGNPPDNHEPCACGKREYWSSK